MDSYASSRAERRIDELEREVRNLKVEADQRKWNDMFRFRFLEDILAPFIWLAACSVIGAGIGTVLGTLIRRAL